MCGVLKVTSRLTGRRGLEVGDQKTHGSSPSTSGKTDEKPSVIQTRRRQCTIGLCSRLSVEPVESLLNSQPIVHDANSLSARSRMEQ